MSRYWIPVVLAVSLALVGADAKADISSTFDSNLEGWTGTDGTASWVSSGGNPGGYLQQVDTVASFMYVSAPAAFLGDLTAYDGGSLSFDGILLTTNNGTVVPDFGTVRISDGVTTATLDLAGAGEPTTSWTTYSATLDATTWGLSQAAWTTLLGGVTSIQVVLEHEFEIVESTGFDNFSIEARFIPEPSAIALLGLGLAAVGGAAWRRRKKAVKD